MSSSKAQLIASLPEAERDAIFLKMSPAEQEALLFDWDFWSRPEQRAPKFNPNSKDGSWRTWLLTAGRGFGKTRTAAEWVRGEIESGRRRNIGLIGPNKSDVRKIMVEGPSGILAVCPPWNHPTFEPTNDRIVWPNGAMCHVFSAEEPERLRGPNLDGIWCIAAGQPISTDKGDVPIEDIRAGDMVLTRSGYRRVIAQTMTNPDAEIWEVITSDHASLLCTDDHPIWVENKGFTPLKFVVPGDKIATCRDTLSGMATVGTRDLPKASPTGSTTNRCLSIVECTRSISGRSLTALRSITRTTITTITSPKIWWRYRVASMEFCIPAGSASIPAPQRRLETNGYGQSKRSKRLPVSLVELISRPAASRQRDDFAPTDVPIDPGMASLAGFGERLRSIASCVAVLSRPQIAASPNTARSAAKKLSIAAKTPTGEPPKPRQNDSESAKSPGCFWPKSWLGDHQCAWWSRSRKKLSNMRHGTARAITWFARHASSHMPLLTRTCAGENTAHIHANSLDAGSGALAESVVVSITKTGRHSPVYDIQVDGEHEFFASGILVHNCDELCSWGNADHIKAVYEMASFCLRIKGPLGHPPAEIITTTPKPSPILRQIMKEPKTVNIGGSTFDNLDNLDESMLDFLRKKYEGTRLGRQELYGVVLESFEGALWTPEQFDIDRLSLTGGDCWRIATGGNSGIPHLIGPKGEMIYFKRIVVSIDPAGSANRKSNETGIITAALGEDEQGYLLRDKSGIYSPDQWAQIAVEEYHFWDADRVLAEQNYGGDMVKSTILAQDANVPVRMMVASKGKRVRAEPVSALYEQHRVHHVGVFPKAEDQMVTWDPFGTGDSPDRLDAIVWAFQDLMLKKPTRVGANGNGYRGPISIYQR